MAKTGGKQLRNIFTMPQYKEGQVLPFEVITNSQPGMNASCLFIGAVIFGIVTGAIWYFNGKFNFFMIITGIGAVLCLLFMIPQLIAYFQSRSIGTLHLETDQSAFTLGDIHPVHIWKEAGSNVSHALSAKLIAFEGIEYRQGTNTTTDKKQVFEKELEVLSDETKAVEEGKWNIAVTVPAHAMASFYQPCNQVHWEIHIFTKVWGWKYSQTFPVQVNASTNRTEKFESLSRQNDSLKLEGDRFLPGETIKGTWKLSRPPFGTWDIRISLNWMTEGKGTFDSGMPVEQNFSVNESDIDVLDEKPFELLIPADAPLSYNGTLLRVNCTIDLEVTNFDTEADDALDVCVGETRPPIHWK